MMHSGHPTRRLLQTLGLGWLAFAGVGWALQAAPPGRSVTVIINQSYCPPAQWQQQVVEPYRALHGQAESRQLTIDQVVVVTDIDHITLPTIPTPEDLGNPFGQAPDPARIVALQQQVAEAVVLQCTAP